jgi:hypothetical protein
MWMKKNWPYRELAPDDVIFWYETPTRKVVWQSQVSRVETFPYATKADAQHKLETLFQAFDVNQPYFAEAPSEGYCLAWKTDPIERLDIARPDSFQLPMIGWARVDGALKRLWGLPNAHSVS